MPRSKLTPAESLWVRHAARIARTWLRKGSSVEVGYGGLAHVYVLRVSPDMHELLFALPCRWANDATATRLAGELRRRLAARR